MPYVLHEGMDDYLTPLSENQFPPVRVVSGKRIKVHQTEKWTGEEDGVDMGEEMDLILSRDRDMVDTSDEAWLQAQLSLSRGGLGLWSLSSHAAAAYIAFLCSSDFSSLSSLHLTSAIGKFNSSVSPSDVVSVKSLAQQPPIQKALSAKIDDFQFNQLFNSSSLADRARLLSISSPHALSWLSAVPSEGLGLQLNPDLFQVAIKWWLGLDTSGGSRAPYVQTLCSIH
eukprot:Em0012g881a